MTRIFTRILTEIPPAPRSTTPGALAQILQTDQDQVIQGAGRLKRRGLIIVSEPGRYQRTAAGNAVIKAGTEIKPGPMRPGIDAAESKRRVRPPRKDMMIDSGSLRERAWSALRILRKATIPEILELAANGDDGRDPAANIRRYLDQLARFGLVVRLDRRTPGIADTSNGCIRYAVIRDWPRAPLWQAASDRLIDRGTGEPIATEGAPIPKKPVSRRRVR